MVGDDVRTGSRRGVSQTLDAVAVAAAAEGKENFATGGCGGLRACGEGEACCRPSDLGDSEDPSTNLSDATRNAINKR